MRRREKEHDMFRQVHVGLHAGVAGVSSTASNGSADVEFVEFHVLRNECVFVAVARHITAAPNMYNKEQPSADIRTKETVVLMLNIVLH